MDSFCTILCHIVSAVTYNTLSSSFEVFSLSKTPHHQWIRENRDLHRVLPQVSSAIPLCPGGFGSDCLF